MPCRKAEKWLERHIVDPIDRSKIELNNLVCFLTQKKMSAVSNCQSVMLGTVGFIVREKKPSKQINTML